MARKLTEEKINEIMETGIREFADSGYDRANTNVIAHKAGISVGVLFKYFKNKEGLFLACLRHSLDILESVLAEVESSGDNAFFKAESLFRTVIGFSRSHGDYIRMYHMITTGSNKALTAKLASEIEGVCRQRFTVHTLPRRSRPESCEATFRPKRRRFSLTICL